SSASGFDDSEATTTAPVHATMPGILVTGIGTPPHLFLLCSTPPPTAAQAPVASRTRDFVIDEVPLPTPLRQHFQHLFRGLHGQRKQVAVAFLGPEGERDGFISVRSRQRTGTLDCKRQLSDWHATLRNITCTLEMLRFDNGYR